MKHSDIIDAVAARAEISRRDATAAVQAVTGIIAQSLKDGQEVSLNGLGKFKVTHKPARTGRNPATGAAIDIAASDKASFRPAKQLSDLLNSKTKSA